MRRTGVSIDRKFTASSSSNYLGVHPPAPPKGRQSQASRIRAAATRAARTIRTAGLALVLGWALSLTSGTADAKFIPTFLVYYGGGPGLVDSDAARLAKFDLLDVDRFRYNNIGSNTWAAIKAINPNVEIYLYEMGPESPSHLDGTAQVSLNGLGRHNISRGHPMGSLNGNQPALFLLDASGNRVYSATFSNVGANQYWYLMDFGSTAYQSYWASAVRADIIDQPWRADGVFADNCLALPGAGGYNTNSQRYPTNASWTGAMNSFIGAITASLHGYSQKLWCNRGETRTVDGSASWRALDNSANPPDVVLEEGVFAVEWGADVWFFEEVEWRRQLDTMSAVRNSKVAMMSHTKLNEGQSSTDNWGRPVTYWQTLWYSMGSFLLGKNDALDNSYFMFNGGEGYNKIWWYDEYDRIDLGEAVGPYSVTDIGSGRVYWREFERGYVYVNPTNVDIAAVTLPQAARPLTRANMLTAQDSIPSVSSIALPSHNAAFLLKASVTATPPTDPVSPFEPVPPAADAQAPSVPTGFTGAAVSASQTNLTWNASTDNVRVTGYYVYLNDVALGTTTTTSFQHTGLVAGTTYNYRVSAFDAIPNHSAWTATPVSLRTPSADTQAPSVPTGLRASMAWATQVNLIWNASTDNIGVSGYRVYLNDVLLATTTQPSFLHSGLSANTTYSYRVSAFDATPNESARSATPLSVRTAVADTQAPSIPAGLAGSASSSSRINLTWNASSDNVGVRGYYVYVNDVAVAITTKNYYRHTGLTRGTTYSYRVSAFDAVPNHSARTVSAVSVRTLP